MIRTSSLSRVEQSVSTSDSSHQLQDLSREIRRLEDCVSANPNSDLMRELDQLRVEYRFQLQMNERNRSRSLNAPYLRSSESVSLHLLFVSIIYLQINI